jgi:putative membrane protein
VVTAGKQLLLSWIANAVVLAIVAGVLSGVKVDSAGALIKAAALFGILNTIVKPPLKALSLPIAFVTLGLVWFGVALLMLLLTSVFIEGFSIHGFWTYIWATIMVWVVNMVLDFVPGPWRGTRRDHRVFRGAKS